MNKLAAILFLFLISLTNFTGKLHLAESGYELASESDQTETDNKKEKKEIKEFPADASKKCFESLSPTSSYNTSSLIILPQPVLDRSTPPPDFRN